MSASTKTQQDWKEVLEKLQASIAAEHASNCPVEETVPWYDEDEGLHYGQEQPRASDDDGVDWNDPSNWISDESRYDTKKLVHGIVEESGYTPDLQELQQYNSVLMFTYGTLKKGYCRQDYMEGATCLGSGTTESDQFVMFRTKGEKGFPIIVPHQSKAKGKIYGEVYRVPVSKVPYLDFMENNGEMYIRTKLPIIIRLTHPKFKGQFVKTECYTYVGVLDYMRKYMDMDKVGLCDRTSARGWIEEAYYVYKRNYREDN